MQESRPLEIASGRTSMIEERCSKMLDWELDNFEWHSKFPRLDIHYSYFLRNLEALHLKQALVSWSHMLSHPSSAWLWLAEYAVLPESPLSVSHKVAVAQQNNLPWLNSYFAPSSKSTMS